MLRRLGVLLSWIGALLGGALIFLGVAYGPDGSIAFPAIAIGVFVALVGLAFRYLFAGI